MTEAASPSHSSFRIVPQNVIPPEEYAAIDPRFLLNRGNVIVETGVPA